MTDAKNPRRRRRGAAASHPRRLQPQTQVDDSSQFVAPGDGEHLSPQSQGSAPPSHGARDLDIDVVKGVLIILVVFGHLLEYFVARDRVFRATFCVLYMFHIPLFVLVSGLLARSALTTADYRKMFGRLLLPLACLQVPYLVLIQLVQGHAVQHILDPQWMLWFFLSLCAWRMMLPISLQIPAALVVFVGIALAAGFSPAIGYQLSASRTLYFFPFFLAGYLYRARLRLFVQRWRILCIGAFIGAAAVTAYWSWHGLDRVALFGSQGYEVATAWDRLPAVGRLGVLALSMVGAVGFWAVVPWTWRPLARVGRRTLSIFALHGFPVIICLKAFSLTHVAPRPYLIVLLLLLAALMAWALSYLDGPFTRFFDWLATRLTKHMRSTPSVPMVLGRTPENENP